jgi:hypothetical protein
MCFVAAARGRRPIDLIALRLTPISLPLASARRPRGIARARRRAMPCARDAGPRALPTGRAVDCMGRQASDCVERDEKEALCGRPGTPGRAIGVLARLLSRAQGGACCVHARLLPGAPGRNRCAQAAGTSRRHRQTEGSPGGARKPAPACVWDIACGLRGPVRAAGRRLRDLQAIRAAAVRGSLPRHWLGARSAVPQLQYGAWFPAG